MGNDVAGEGDPPWLRARGNTTQKRACRPENPRRVDRWSLALGDPSTHAEVHVTSSTGCPAPEREARNRSAKVCLPRVSDMQNQGRVYSHPRVSLVTGVSHECSDSARKSCLRHNYISFEKRENMADTRSGPPYRAAAGEEVFTEVCLLGRCCSHRRSSGDRHWGHTPGQQRLVPPCPL